LSIGHNLAGFAYREDGTELISRNFNILYIGSSAEVENNKHYVEMEILLEYCFIDYLEQFVNKRLFIKTVLLYAFRKHSLSEGKAQCIVSKWQVEIPYLEESNIVRLENQFLCIIQ
jgi:hypothetical protein